MKESVKALQSSALDIATSSSVQSTPCKCASSQILVRRPRCKHHGPPAEPLVAVSVWQTFAEHLPYLGEQSTSTWTADPSFTKRFFFDFCFKNAIALRTRPRIRVLDFSLGGFPLLPGLRRESPGHAYGVSVSGFNGFNKEFMLCRKGTADGQRNFLRIESFLKLTPIERHLVCATPCEAVSTIFQ